MRTVLLLLLAVGCTTEENVGNEPPALLTVTPAVGSARWAISFGTSTDDFGMGVAINSIGDVIGVANLAQPLQAGGSAYSLVTQRTAFDGSERWSTKLTPQDAASSVWIRGTAIAPDDSITVVGTYMGTVDFGGQMLTTASNVDDAFIATYDGSGALQSVHGLAGAGTLGADIYALAIDSTGAVVIGGDFEGTLAVGSASYTSDGTDDDYYLAKLDPSGSVLWSHELGVPLIRSAVIDASDDVWLTGQFTGTASVGGAVLDADAYMRGYVSEFRGDGLYLQSYAVGASDPGESNAVALATSSTGDVVVDSIDHMPLPALAAPALYAFDDAATPMWSMTLPYSVSPTLIATADGRYASLAWIDGGTTGSFQIATLDADGSASTVNYGERDATSAYNTGIVASATNANGTVASIGNYAGTIDFGSGPITDSGSGDVFLVLSNSP
ncbi:MAG TPA: hypothetical protein VGL61_30125 [Kofleriaceae bacterium]|jgi:hypothetical protein